MNKIINKFLLTGDKFMPEMHLRQPGFNYSAADHLLKTEKTQKIKEKENSRYTYQNEVDKACFEYGLTYGDFKDLLRRTASVKLLRDKSFNIAKNPKYVGYQRHLASMVYSFFFLIKRPLLVAVVEVKLCQTENQLKNNTNQLLQNLRNKKYNHLLQIIFRVLIKLICNC